MLLERPVLRPGDLARDLDRLFEGFETRFAAQDTHLSLTLHGSELGIATSDPDFAAAIRARVWQSPGPAERKVRLVLAHGAPDLPIPQWAAPELNLREIEAELEPSRYRLHVFADRNFWQVWDRERLIGLQLAPGPGSLPDWEADAPLRHFLHWHFGDLGLRMTHAGTLGHAGRGIAFAGKGGSGKSGTVLGGVEAGLTSVGDDYVLIESTTHGIIAHPVFTTLKQDRRGLDRLGMTARLTEGRAPNWQEKYTFPSTAVGAVRPADLPLTALMIPEVVGAGPTRITPLSHREAFLALAPSGLAQIAADRMRGFAAYAEIARRLPCYRLALGPDPDEVTAALTAFLTTGTP